MKLQIIYKVNENIRTERLLTDVKFVDGFAHFHTEFGPICININNLIRIKLFEYHV